MSVRASRSLFEFGAVYGTNPGHKTWKHHPWPARSELGGSILKDLAARGRSVSNARRIRKHLPPALAAKIVALLAERDFSTWRDDLLDGGMPSATFVRRAKAIKAALALCDMRSGMAHRCQEPLARVDQRVTLPLTSLVVLPALPSLPKDPATWPQFSLHQA